MISKDDFSSWRGGWFSCLHRRLVCMHPLICGVMLHRYFELRLSAEHPVNFCLTEMQFWLYCKPFIARIVQNGIHIGTHKERDASAGRALPTRETCLDRDEQCFADTT